MTARRSNAGSSLPALLLLLAVLLILVATSRDLTGYGRWFQRHQASDAASRLRQVAGPTASWLPGVLRDTTPQDRLLMVNDKMTDADWLAAYYLYPRTLHVVSPDALASGRDKTVLPAADYLLRQGRLSAWPQGTPPATRTGENDVLPPPPPSARGVLALLLMTIAALGWGSMCMSRLSPRLAVDLHPAGRWGLALLAGLGIQGGLGFICAFAGQTASWWLTLFLLAGGLFTLVGGSSWLRPAAAEPRSRVSIILAVATLTLVSLTMVRALGEPMLHWDERFQWAYKAKVLLHEGGVHGPTFQSADRPHLHRRYPLLLPALEAQTARLAGGFTQERAVKGLFPLFFLGLLLTAHGALRQRLPGVPAWLFTLLLAALPPWHLATRIQGGPAHTGFADLPLAACATALALCLIPASRGDRPQPAPAWAAAALFAGLCFSMKPEGISFLAAAALVAVLMVLSRKFTPTRRDLLLGGTLLTLLIIPVLAMHSMVPTVGTVGYSGDENYLSRLTVSGLTQGVQRNLPTAAMALLKAPFSAKWAFYGILPALGLALSLFIRRRPAPSHLMALLIAVPLAADLLAFTVTGSEVQWHLAVALDRLWLQVAPLMLIMAGGQWGRLTEKHQS